MNVLFRTDASKEIGTGHFMRCFTLALCLQKRGASIRFFCNDLPPYLVEMLAHKNIEYRSLKIQKKIEDVSHKEINLPYSHWLASSQLDDANETKKYLVDKIWLKQKFTLEGHELFEEINHKLFKTEIDLMSNFISSFNKISPIKQSTDSSNYRRKRNLEDSCLDINKSIKDQFNLLRVVDKNRYPAFFDYMGFRYIIKIEKVENE